MWHIWGQENIVFILDWRCLNRRSVFPTKSCILFTKCLSFFLSSRLQVSGWPSASFPQERSAPRHLLPSVALARPAVPPRAAGGGAVRVRLPHKEGRSVCEPIPLPESRDARYDSLESSSDFIVVLTSVKTFFPKNFRDIFCGIFSKVQFYRLVFILSNICLVNCSYKFVHFYCFVLKSCCITHNPDMKPIIVAMF